MELKMRRHDERRSKFRFGIQREIRYKMLENGVVIASGTGLTENVCSGGVAFIADHQLTPGAFVELSISWPVLLDYTCPMRLIIFGRVLRCSGKRNVCSIDKYEFRTQGRTFQLIALPRKDGMLQRWAEGFRKEIIKTSQLGA